MAVNALYYNATNNELVEASNSDFQVLAQYVLTQLVSSNQFSLSLTNSGSLTSIGAFVDLYTAPVGTAVSDDGSAIQTLTKNVYQAQTSTITGSNPPDYVGYTVNGLDIVLQERATTLNDIADLIISYVVTPTYGGPGSWYAGAEAPADGGTWVSAFSIVDLTDTNTNTVYYFWKKTTESTGVPSVSSITKRPMKLSGNEIIEFTDAEIGYLVKTVAERIQSTGINFYSLSSTMPATGTWALASDPIYDYRRNITSNVNKTGTFDTAYTTAYAGTVTYFDEFQSTDPNGSPSQAYYMGPPAIYTRESQNVYVGPGGNFLGPVQVTYFTGGTIYFGGPIYLGPSYNYYTSSTSATVDFTSSYTSTYTADYTGGLIDSSTTLTNVTYLWRRIA